MKDEVRECHKCHIQVTMDYTYRPPVGIDPKTEKGTCPNCRIDYYFIPEIKVKGKKS